MTERNDGPRSRIDHHASSSPRESDLAASLKPSFRDAWKWGQRCLVVTDRFYKWKKLDAKGKEKQPYEIAMADDQQTVMAGLWTKWKSPKREEVLSCTVLTCDPNNVIGALHDRMPVILGEVDWAKWLGEEPATATGCLKVIGVLGAASSESGLPQSSAFSAGLQEVGYQRGRDVDLRSAGPAAKWEACRRSRLFEATDLPDQSLYLEQRGVQGNRRK